MKKYFIVIILSLLVSGCYTLFDHPEVEVVYEEEKSETVLVEEYKVFVDEDCSTCHDDFIAQKHFNQFVPAHDVQSNWNDLPWWLDTKYLMFFSDPHEASDDSSSGDYGYQHVGAQQRSSPPPIQSTGYIPVSSGGGSGSSGATAAQAQPKENSDPPSNSRVRDQDSKSSSRSSSTKAKRTFRKRK